MRWLLPMEDENSDEDFEDWESIGLNVSKPPDLGRIYRGFANGSTCFVGAKKPGLATNSIRRWLFTIKEQETYN